MPFSHNASTITVTGFEDSDTLKAYVTANSLGTVNGALLLLSPARNVDIQGDFVSYNTTYSGATFRSGIVTPLTAVDFGYLGDYGPVEGGAIIISNGVSNQSFQKRGGFMRFYGTKVMITSSVRCDLGSFNADTVGIELNGASIERYGSGSCIFYAKGARFFGDPVTIYNLTTALQNPEGVQIETELKIRNCQTAVSAASSDALLLKDVVVGQEVVRDIQSKYYASFVRGNMRKGNMYFLQKSGSDFRPDPYIKNFAAIKIRTVDSIGLPLEGVRFYSVDNAGQVDPDQSGVTSINAANSNAQGQIGELLVNRWGAFYDDQPSISGTTLVSVFRDYDLHMCVRKYGYLPQFWVYPQASVPDFGDRATYSNLTVALDPMVTISEQDAANLTSVSTLEELHAAVQYWATRPENDLSFLEIGFNPSTAALDVGINFGNINLFFDIFAADLVSYDSGSNTLTIRTGLTLSASPGLPSFTTFGVVESPITAIQTKYTDANGTRLNLSIGGQLFTALVEINGVKQPLSTLQSSLTLTVTPGATVRMVIGAQGRKSRYINTTGAALIQSSTFNLDIDPAIDPTVPQWIIDEIAPPFESVMVGDDVVLYIPNDLKEYSPPAVLAAVQYWTVLEGQDYFNLCLDESVDALIGFSNGAIEFLNSMFYMKPSEDWGVSKVVPNTGVGFPLVVTCADLLHECIQKNAAGVPLCVAGWTQATARLSADQAQEIRDAKVASEAVNLRLPLEPASQQAVQDIVPAIFTQAQTTPVQADIRKINDVTIQGAGVPGDSWGPVE